MAKSDDAMAARVVRYADLKPCLNAFIDTRTPGSEAKENFTIIGPGVSENPDQHVHIPEAHGFNIGGARQPPNCVNSQHSHETAEVFVAHSGRWRFDLGEYGEDAQVEMGPGDLISLPTRAFRGFTNIGEDVGFLWAVLGGDDPGRVTWAPRVFEMAKDYGLVLMENGSLVDTAAGQTPPAGVSPMTPTSPEQVRALRRFTQAEAEALVVRAPASDAPGETLLIGPGGPLDWSHGFTLSRIRLAAGGELAAHQRREPDVVFVQEGEVELGWGDGVVRLGPGDTATVPSGAQRSLRSSTGAVVFAVRGGDRPSLAQAA